MEIPYVVAMPRKAFSTAGTIVQLTAGAHPLSILEWKVNQTDLAMSQLHEVSVVRLSSAGTGAAASPEALASGAPAAGFTAMVADFSAQGVVASVLEMHAWNVVNSSLPWNPVPVARVEIPPGASAAIRLSSASVPNPLNLFGYVKVLERR